MNAIFEGVIEFDESKNILIQRETNDHIPLTNSTAILLKYLMSNQGETISRESILENVFKKNALTDSESNLNQNLSLLRRGFRELGFEREIFITKPRVGIVMSQDVNIRYQKPHNVAEAGYFWSILKSKITLVSIFLIGLIASTYFASDSSFRFFIPVGLIDEGEVISNCQSYLVNNSNNTKNSVVDLIMKESLACTAEDKIYLPVNFQSYTTVKTFVYCPSGTKNRRAGCKTYLYQE